jgi:hypothetical protein
MHVCKKNLQYVFKRVCTYNGIYANAPVIRKASVQESLQLERHLCRRACYAKGIFVRGHVVHKASLPEGLSFERDLCKSIIYSKCIFKRACNSKSIFAVCTVFTAIKECCSSGACMLSRACVQEALDLRGHLFKISCNVTQECLNASGHVAPYAQYARIPVLEEGICARGLVGRRGQLSKIQYWVDLGILDL